MVALKGWMMRLRKKKNSAVPGNLTNKVNGHRVQDMRKIVHARMKQLPMTAYAVAKATGVKPQTMSNFLRGGSMRSDKLERVFAVLRLEVKPRD